MTTYKKRQKNDCKEMQKLLPWELHSKLTKWKRVDQNQTLVCLIYFPFPLKFSTHNEVIRAGIKIRMERLEKTEPGKKENEQDYGS